MLPQKWGGLHGYIGTSYADNIPTGYGFGASFYSAVWPLLETPLDGFQIGMPGLWLMPENGDFKVPLCPPGTHARDNWPERGPTWASVFQTIEGGVGFWQSTQFKTRSPKFRMNGTPNCYDGEISSSGWGFGNPEPLPSDQMGIAQLSNRLLVPPDGMTFAPGMRGELFGTAWMSLPLMDETVEFVLTTREQESANLFLEANEVVAGAALGGASHLAPPVSGDQVPVGQAWKIVPLPDGYFALTTAWSEAKGYYLECNQPGSGSALGGASFMAKGTVPNGLSTGQKWRLQLNGDGYAGLTTRFLENQGRWLAAGFLPLFPFHRTAFMSGPDPAGGGLLASQQWKLIPLRRGLPMRPGPNSWTLFVNSRNFRGPVAFWLPETWARLAKSYPEIQDRGLDARPAFIPPGAMEINLVPFFEGKDAQGNTYARIPRIQFPLAKSGVAGISPMMVDLVHYPAASLYHGVWAWLRGAGYAPEPLNALGYRPRIQTSALSFDQPDTKLPIPGFGKLVGSIPIPSSPGTFALAWDGKQVDISADYAAFPEYLKRVGGELVAVPESQVPDATGLKAQTFRPPTAGRPYVSKGGQWTTPGRSRVGGEVRIADGSTVTYDWYRFVDQPALQHLNLSPAQKDRLQAVAERIHQGWTPDRQYLPSPSRPEALAVLDLALMVTPPVGLERGYVPIVTGQRFVSPYSLLTPQDIEGTYVRQPVENDWHSGELLVDVSAGGKYRWSNKAKATWLLAPDFANGAFMAGADSPYPGTTPLVLTRDPQNPEVELPKVQGIRIQGELYLRTGGPVPRPKLSIVPATQGKGVTISWSGTGKLEAAPSPLGPWGAAVSSQSPVTVAAGAAARFYRLAVP